MGDRLVDERRDTSVEISGKKRELICRKGSQQSCPGFCFWFDFGKE